MYYTLPMAMGKRKRDRQPNMWVAATDFPTAASHPFYTRLNQLLRAQGFDDFAEAQCATFYAETMGRPSLPPGIYFRLLLIGYFEGIDSERGIAWRAADSFALRDFLGVGLEDAPPDHSTISRTPRLIDLETHRAVFTWVLQCLSTGRPGEGQDDRHRRDDARSERPCAHLYETGGLRRAHVRGHENVLKRLLVHAGAFNLGLWMRTLFGVGTPRGLQGRLAALDAVLSALCSLTGEAIALIAIQINRRAGSVRRLNTIRRLSLKTPLVPRAARPPTGLGSNGSPKPPKHRVNDGLADTSKQDESTT